jgi:hypothetical protein
MALINDAVQIINDARLELGDIGLKIARNIQDGLNNSEDQKKLRKRLLWTYIILDTLDPIIKFDNSGNITSILEGASHTKLNRAILCLKNVSKARQRPILPGILNPVSQSISGSGPAGPTGADGQSAFLYVGYADDSSGAGYSTSPASKTYVAFKISATEIPSPSASTFSGLWRKFVGDDGADGDVGNDGNAGESSYNFIAYASADDGTDFTLTFNPSLDYIAFITKSTNTPPLQAEFTGLWKNYKGADGGAGADGADAYVYIAYADADDGTGFTTTFDANKDYIAILSTDTEIPSPSVGDFAGLWKNYKGDTGGDGADGSDGADGTNAYLYIAYADDVNGTNFTTTFDPNKDYIALLQSAVEIVAPDASDFSGLWRKYRGNGDRYKTYSSTSLTIGTGTKYLQVENSLAYTPGQRVIIVLPNDANTRMEGLVLFYDASDGQMQVDVDVTEGSGTNATWDVNLVGAPVSAASTNAYFATLATDQGSGGSNQALSTTPAKLTAFDTVLSQSAAMAASTSTDDITISNNGAYVVDFNATVSGTAGADLLLQIYKNAVAVANAIARVLFDASGNPQNVAIHYVDETAMQEDVYDVRAVASAGTPNVKLEQARFSLYTIGFINTEQHKNFENSDVDTGTETVDNFAATLGNAAKFEVLIKKAANFRYVTLLVVWDGTNPPNTSTVGPDLSFGTIDVTVTADFSGGDIRLRATATSDDWTVKGKRTIVG